MSKDNASPAPVRIEAAPKRGMIAVRADLNTSVMGEALQAAGLKIPQQGTCCRTKRGYSTAWMSEDEILAMVPVSATGRTVEMLETALADTHSMVADMSDARAVFAVKGAGARDVLAKLSPVDLRPEKFDQGNFCRTRLAQVPAALWLREKECIEVFCFRSVADYVRELLEISAMQGSEPNVLS